MIFQALFPVNNKVNLQHSVFINTNNNLRYTYMFNDEMQVLSFSCTIILALYMQMLRTKNLHKADEL